MEFLPKLKDLVFTELLDGGRQGHGGAPIGAALKDSPGLGDQVEEGA